MYTTDFVPRLLIIERSSLKIYDWIFPPKIWETKTALIAPLKPVGGKLCNWIGKCGQASGEDGKVRARFFQNWQAKKKTTTPFYFLIYWQLLTSILKILPFTKFPPLKWGDAKCIHFWNWGPLHPLPASTPLIHKIIQFQMKNKALSILN
jgi:hypothetical protein